MNSKYTVGGIFCDLQKAFDCVHHNILLVTLKFHGIKDAFFTLVRSYLEGRYETVIIANSTYNHNTSSSWMEIKHGVPKGSILGPLFV